MLEKCIRAVLDQPYDNMELVVTDNANVDETQDVLARFAGDGRLKVVRLDDPAPVTASWNAAFRASSGDYLVLIGDDDYLLPGYFETVESLVRSFRGPDCITYNAYSFVAKDAVQGIAESFFGESHFRFGNEYRDRQPLSADTRRAIVRDLFRFKQRLPMNMQMTLVSRRVVDRLSNGLFRSPFPDHYALSALLIRADTWFYSSAKPVVVGVSPKSFGRHFHSGRPDTGLEYLGVETLFPDRLPGNEVLNAICVWLIELKRHYPAELRDVELSRSDYVLRQLFAWYRQRKSGALPTRDALARVARIPARDWAGLIRTPFNSANWAEARRVLHRDRGEASHPLLRNLTPLPGVPDIDAFGKWVAARDGLSENVAAVRVA